MAMPTIFCLFQTQAVDVFAFGLVSYFIFSGGRHPFHRRTRRRSSVSGSFSDGSDVEGEDGATVSARPPPPPSLREVFSSLGALQSMQKAIADQKEPCIEEVFCYTHRHSPPQAKQDEVAKRDDASDKMRGTFCALLRGLEFGRR